MNNLLVYIDGMSMNTNVGTLKEKRAAFTDRFHLLSPVVSLNI